MKRVWGVRHDGRKDGKERSDQERGIGHLGESHGLATAFIAAGMSNKRTRKSA